MMHFSACTPILPDSVSDKVHNYWITILIFKSYKLQTYQPHSKNHCRYQWKGFPEDGRLGLNMKELKINVFVS